jgi:4-diphosphocytidyl-2-C-methyl-D-erythritol kinase
MENISILAPAKINIHLDILKKRTDGYHDILSLFQSVSLYDELLFSELPEKNCVKIQGFAELPRQENIIWRAIQLFRKYSGISTGISVMLHKHIPYQSGLGGGSSDAAATLRALNHLFSCPLPNTALEEIGLQLGSDVCFFLNSAVALVSGRGENIEPVPSRLDLTFVIIMPGFKVRTQDAYSWFDDESDLANFKRLSKNKILFFYTRHSPRRWPFYNSFFPVLSKRYPKLKEIIQKLKIFGTSYVGLSGSGSALFAVLNDEEKAAEILTEFKRIYEHIFLVKPLERIPQIEIVKKI